MHSIAVFNHQLVYCRRFSCASNPVDKIVWRYHDAHPRSLTIAYVLFLIVHLYHLLFVFLSEFPTLHVADWA